jgi:hypothetical protein
VVRVSRAPTLTPARDRAKAVTPICSDDEVSSDDDHPLYRRRRLLRSSGCPISGPPPPGQQSPAVVATPRPSSSVVASLVIAPSMPDAIDEAMVISRAAAEKEAADVAATKKAADDAAMAERVVVDAAAEKNATYDAAVAESEAADAAIKMKATDDATVVTERAVRDKRAADAATEKKVADNVAVVEGATTEVASWGVVESSPTPVVGAKRTDVSGGSTPPAKHRFCGSWKPRYAVGPYICPSTLYAYLFHLDSSLCIVSPSSRTPTPRADQTHGSAMGHDP